MKIGLLAMSAKPPTAGHVALIRIASKECDEVKLFVSLNDRKRSNEVPVLGVDMEPIWREMIQPSLPKNVSVTYVKNQTPVRKVYELLGKMNDERCDDEFVIYSDPHDMERNYPASSLDKYLFDLHSRGRIRLEPVSRNDTVDVSGTKMRQWLKDGDKDSFIAHLPEIIQDRGDEIWNTMQISIAANPVTKKRK